MSFDIQLFRKDKLAIKKKELEKVLFEQHWIMRLPEDDSYALMHSDDHSYIEISHTPEETAIPFSKSQIVDTLKLMTWATSSEWTLNHLIRLVFLLSEKLNLIVYDPQLGKNITVRDVNKLEKSYFEWRLRVKAFNLKLDVEAKKLIPITVFIACSFLPSDDLINDYIIDLLRYRVKEVLTGRPYETMPISKKVQEKIKKSTLLIAILLKRGKIAKNKYRTSQWIKDEAIFAAGAKKDIIFLKEKGVEDLPSIFGDYEWIPLDRYHADNAIKEIDVYLKKYKK